MEDDDVEKEEDDDVEDDEVEEDENEDDNAEDEVEDDECEKEEDDDVEEDAEDDGNVADDEVENDDVVEDEVEVGDAESRMMRSKGRKVMMLKRWCWGGGRWWRWGGGPIPRPEPTLCASLRSRNALGHFRKGTLYGILQVKCGPPWTSTGLYHYRNHPSVWTHCLGNYPTFITPGVSRMKVVQNNYFYDFGTFQIWFVVMNCFWHGFAVMMLVRF